MSILSLLCLHEAFDETERGVGDLPPAAVEGQRVPAVFDLADLGSRRTWGTAYVSYSCWTSSSPTALAKAYLNCSQVSGEGAVGVGRVAQHRECRLQRRDGQCGHPGVNATKPFSSNSAAQRSQLLGSSHRPWTNTTGGRPVALAFSHCWSSCAVIVMSLGGVLDTALAMAAPLDVDNVHRRQTGALSVEATGQGEAAVAVSTTAGCVKTLVLAGDVCPAWTRVSAWPYVYVRRWQARSCAGAA